MVAIFVFFGTRVQYPRKWNARLGSSLSSRRSQATMRAEVTTIVVAHPDRYGLIPGPWGCDRFVFDLRDLHDGEKAERRTRRMAEYRDADRFRRTAP